MIAATPTTLLRTWPSVSPAWFKSRLMGQVSSDVWVSRLVRAEMNLEDNRIRCCRLRRQAPQDQPLVNAFKYVFPEKHFHSTRPTSDGTPIFTLPLINIR
jgi:hypothetical protein